MDHTPSPSMAPRRRWAASASFFQGAIAAEGFWEG